MLLRGGRGGCALRTGRHPGHGSEDATPCRPSPATPQTLTDAVAAIVAARGEQLAVQDREGTVRFTWRELRDAAARVAGGLAALGAGRDATVGLLLDNRPEFHVADLAAVLLGAVPVSIYATSSPSRSRTSPPTPTCAC